MSIAPGEKKPGRSRSAGSKKAIVVGLVGLTAGFVAACRRAEAPATIEFQPGRFTSSERCGTCHKDIYSAWRGSRHAASVEGDIFKASYHDALQATGGEAKKICPVCHAPTVVVTGDWDLAQPLTREGITCDFCHSLKDTDRSQPGHPFILDLGDVKRGPIRDAVSTGHRVLFSEFHLSSEQCAGCHEYRNAQGVDLLTTYSEWQRYQQRGGDKNCQQCHMPQVLANIVDPKVKRLQGAFVNLHFMPGGHSRDQLVKSLSLGITEVVRTPQGVRVKVTVRNVGAGHAVPTGSPTRKILLRLTASGANGTSATAERIYQRVVADERGQEITIDSHLFTHARKVLRDTRLQPGEQRTEEFFFPAQATENLTVMATLTYLYSPHARKETETRIEFARDKKELLAKWRR